MMKGKEFCVGKKPIGEVVRKDTSEEQKDEGVEGIKLNK
jgi:hypothetical protein